MPHCATGYICVGIRRAPGKIRATPSRLPVGRTTSATGHCIPGTPGGMGHAEDTHHRCSCALVRCPAVRRHLGMEEAHGNVDGRMGRDTRYSPRPLEDSRCSPPTLAGGSPSGGEATRNMPWLPEYTGNDLEWMQYTTCWLQPPTCLLSTPSSVARDFILADQQSQVCLLHAELSQDFQRAARRIFQGQKALRPTLHC